MLEETVTEGSDSGTASIALAKVKVSKLFEVSNSSMLALCQDVEQASTKEATASAFRQPNKFTTILTTVDPLGTHELVREALVALQVSESFETSLTTISPVCVALQQYIWSETRLSPCVSWRLQHEWRTNMTLS